MKLVPVSCKHPLRVVVNFSPQTKSELHGIKRKQTSSKSAEGHVHMKLIVLW